jgi:hypothetical protein
VQISGQCVGRAGLAQPPWAWLQFLMGDTGDASGTNGKRDVYCLPQQLTGLRAMTGPTQRTAMRSPGVRAFNWRLTRLGRPRGLAQQRQPSRPL